MAVSRQVRLLAHFENVITLSVKNVVSSQVVALDGNTKAWSSEGMSEEQKEESRVVAIFIEGGFCYFAGLGLSCIQTKVLMSPTADTR